MPSKLINEYFQCEIKCIEREPLFFLDYSISICLVIVSIGVTMLRFHCTVYMYKSSKMLLNLPDTVKIPRINNTFIMFVVFFFKQKVIFL